MKKSKLLLMLGAGLVAVIFAARVLADDTNEVTLTGLMVCGKCKLHITKECQNVLQVEQNGTNVNYFLIMNKVSTDFHQNICENDGEKATATGTVWVDNGTNMMRPTKIEAAK